MVTMNARMKVYAQCTIAASKSNHAVLGMIGRNKNNEYCTIIVTTQEPQGEQCCALMG